MLGTILKIYSLLEVTMKNNISPTIKSISEISEDTDYDYLKTSSACDCTGLIPAAPLDANEIEHYEELYPFLPPHHANTKK